MLAVGVILLTQLPFGGAAVHLWRTTETACFINGSKVMERAVITIEDITIDKEFSEILTINNDEKERLKTEIDRDGYRDPVVVWANHNILLDGHTRLEIYEKHHANDDKIDPPTILEKHFDDRESAKAWVIINQLARRNLTPFQKTELALQLEPSIKQKAKQQQGARSDISVNMPKSEPIDTRHEIAKAAGVSPKQVDKVKAIKKKGSPELQQEVRSGEKSIRKAHEEIKGKPTKNSSKGNTVNEKKRSAVISAGLAGKIEKETKELSRLLMKPSFEVSMPTVKLTAERLSVAVEELSLRFVKENRDA